MSSADIRARLLNALSVSESSADNDFCKLLRLLDMPDDKSLISMINESGIDKDLFKSVTLESRYFQNEDITDYIFDECIIHRTVFITSLLNNTSIRNSNINDCAFAGISGHIIFDGSEILNTKFIDVNLFGFSNNSNIYEKCSFNGSSIVGFQSRADNFGECNFYASEITLGDFDRSKFAVCDFSTSKILQSTFRSVSFEEVSFVNTYLLDCSFRGNDLNGCDFSGSTLTGTDFFGCKINKNAFDGADLKGARFGENRGLNWKGQEEFVRRGAIFPQRIEQLELA
jgi:uncharacterized protein YjbI with pentapeptide repeats